nr:winged helix-turn-helix transcriptional regulator [Rhizobium leguminosarum]
MATRRRSTSTRRRPSSRPGAFLRKADATPFRIYSHQIVDVFKDDRERITSESDRAGSALRIHDLFQQNPFMTANQLVQQTGLSAPTVNAALTDLERFGVVEERHV